MVEPNCRHTERVPAELACLIQRLTDEEKMLLTIRDELYEGSWGLMVQDLRDRLEGRPHVFEICPPSARLRDTIAGHLQLIEQLRHLERQHGTNLGALVRDVG